MVALAIALRIVLLFVVLQLISAFQEPDRKSVV